MYVEQMYTGCLAEAAYYIESNGEAAIIDPLRETAPYLAKAEERGATIKYVFETHFHADFVSGHVDLARETGATIIYGPNASAGYEIEVAEDGQEFKLGEVSLKVLHTPGHTLESSCFLLKNEQGEDYAVFTGDTLFIGDVGRPDLAVKSDLSKEDLAGLLYDSLHDKLLKLGDDVIVFPGHGAGSQCGKHLSDEKQSTIGEQKKFNYALQPMSKDKFVDVVTEGQNEPPAYFPENALINKMGYENINDVMERNLKPLTVEQFEMDQESGSLILDTRSPDEFEKGFIPGSVNIGLDGSFAVWVGSLIQIKQPLIIVAPKGREEETVKRLARVGYEQVRGYLEGGYEAWVNAGKVVKTISSIEPDQVKEYQEKGYYVLDVRRPSETQTQHVKEAVNIELQNLEKNLDKLPKDKPFAVHCAGGYRSMIAGSLLKRHGYNNFVNVHLGFNVMKDLDNLSFEYGQCPTEAMLERIAATN